MRENKGLRMRQRRCGTAIQLLQRPQLIPRAFWSWDGLAEWSPIELRRPDLYTPTGTSQWMQVAPGKGTQAW